MIKKHLKRLSASAALLMIGLMLALPFFSFSAGAETKQLSDWTTERSGKIHQIVDYAELTDDQTHFSLTYDVKGGRDFRFHYGTDWAKWEGEVKAAPGEVVTVAYTATYPTPVQIFGFESVAKDYTIENSLRESTYYFNEDISKDTFTYLHDNDTSSSSTTKKGSFSLNVPKIEDLKNISKTGKSKNEITMCVTSRQTQTYKNQTDRAQTATLSFYIDVIVDMNESGDADGVTNNASTEKGETGTTVPAAIVFGTIAAGAGIAGAVAAGGSKSSDKGNNDGGSIKMYVGKDFGDGIRKGSKPVKIRARMVEEKDGKERPRPDLNPNISVTGQDLNIVSAVQTATHVEVMVSVDAACESDTAIITFIYNGKGGTFRNNIVFKVVSEPYLEYEAEPSEGYYSGAYPEAIFGDKITYNMKFYIANTTGYPEDIKVKSLTPELDAKLVRDTAVEYGYILTVVNKTEAPEEKKILFDGDQTRDVEITAVFEDGTKLISNAGLTLYPEGILVEADKKDIRDNSLLIRTIPDSGKVSAAEGKKNEAPETKYKVHLSYVDKNGKSVHIENPEFKLKDPEDKGKYGKVFTESFKYENKKTGSSKYGSSLKSLVALPMLDEPYYAEMELTVQHDGVTYSEDMPVAVLGETSDVPPSRAEMEKAIRLLKKDIQFFGISSDPELKKFVRNAYNHSPAEIEYIRRAIIEAGVAFAKEEGLENQNLDQLCTKYIIVASAILNITDTALVKLADKQWPGCGGVVMKFIIPLKNMLATWAGQYIGPGSELDGPKENMSFYKTVMESCREALVHSVTGDGYKPSTDALGYIVAGYLLTCFIENYYGLKDYKGAKGDVYKSIVASLSDLTIEAFKAWFLKMLEGCLKSAIDKFGKVIGDACGSLYKNYLKTTMTKSVQKAGQDAFDSALREGIKYNGGQISKEVINTAEWARSAAKSEQIKFLMDTANEAAKGTSEAVSKFIGDCLKSDKANLLFAFLLNYAVGGKEKDNESLGGTTEEVIYGYFQDRFGLKVTQIINNIGNPMDVSIRTENGKFVIGIFGYSVHFDILENFKALSSCAFDYLFTWMDVIWNTAKSGLESGLEPKNLKDPRDTMEKNAQKVIAMCERNLERLENMPPIEFQSPKT